jgi:hypothetical protein
VYSRHCHSAAAVLWPIPVPVLVPLSFWPVQVDSRKATCGGGGSCTCARVQLSVCVCVCVCVCRTAPYRTYPLRVSVLE